MPYYVHPKERPVANADNLATQIANVLTDLGATSVEPYRIGDRYQNVAFYRPGDRRDRYHLLLPNGYDRPAYLLLTWNDRNVPGFNASAGTDPAGVAARAVAAASRIPVRTD